ncbi:hypothetical protein MMC25_004258 [Agyrium rufum]|nr:hypothetical protein [Agyrium rufum]
MAAPDAAVIELAESLTLDEIPIKLRHYVRALSLESNCPVCLHEPVQKDECRPNRALRTTIKAFLKKKGIEKDAAVRRKEKISFEAPSVALPATPAVTSVTESAPVNDVPATALHNVSMYEASSGDSARQSVIPSNVSKKAPEDWPQPSIETSLPMPENAFQAEPTPIPESRQRVDIDPTNLVDHEVTHQSYEQASNSLGHQGMMNGQFPPFTGSDVAFAAGPFGSNDYSQILPYVANGMPNGMMGNFPPFAAMPQMGLDPMAVTYGGFGGTGPGMVGANGMNGTNGMNVGMGYDAGKDAYGGYKGQTNSWDAGQNYNMGNAYGGYGHDQVGMNNNYGGPSGYNGYNMPSHHHHHHQGNFPQMNQQNFSHNDHQSGYQGPGYKNRGRGRRGGFNQFGRGRGSYNQMNHGHDANQGNYNPAFQHQIPPQSQQPYGTGQNSQSTSEEYPAGASNTYEQDHSKMLQSEEAVKAAEERMNKELEPGDHEDAHVPVEANAETQSLPVETQPGDEGEKSDVGKTSERSEVQTENAHPELDGPNSKSETLETPVPIETFISSDYERSAHQSRAPIMGEITNGLLPEAGISPVPFVQGGFPETGGRGRGFIRGGFRGAIQSRGGYRGRGGYYATNGHEQHTHSHDPTFQKGFAPTIPSEPKGVGVQGAPTGPKALREGPTASTVNASRGFSIVGRASTSVTQAQPASSHSRRYVAELLQGVPSTVADTCKVHRLITRSPALSHLHAINPLTTAVTAIVPVALDDTRKRTKTLSRTGKKKAGNATSRKNRRRVNLPTATIDVTGTAARAETGKEKSIADTAAIDPTQETKSASPSFPPQPPPKHPASKTASRMENLASADQTTMRIVHHENDRAMTGPLRPQTRTTVIPTAPSKDVSFQPPTGPRSQRQSISNTMNNARRPAAPPVPSAAFASHGRSESKPQEQQEQQPPPAQAVIPEKDVHTLEREARNRERMMKEMQRREAMEGIGKGGLKLRKGSSGGGFMGGRNKSYKYDDDMLENYQVGRA